LYALAYQKCNNSTDKAIIKSGLDRLNQEYISNLNRKLYYDLKEMANEKSGFNFKLLQEEQIFKILEFIMQEITLNCIDHFKNTLNTMADYCKKAGDYLFKTKNYSKAIRFYQKAIELHTEYLQTESPDELFKLYSNLIIVYVKKMDWEAVIQTADLALKMTSIVDVTKDKNQLIFEKINYHKANALIKLCKKSLEEKNNQETYNTEFILKINNTISNVKNIEMGAQLTREVILLKSKYFEREEINISFKVQGKTQG
jgi:tetratricopeptide (TPR) repeat protein